MILPARWRAALSRAVLVVLLGAEVPRDAVRDAPARVSRAASLEPAADSFWFDPGYARFVEAVRRETPEDATIALVVPKTTDLYVYRAVYGLVPRRVVPPEERASAPYVAVYGDAGPGSAGAGKRIPGGILLRR